MSLTLRTHLGNTEAVLAEEGSLNLFYRITDLFDDLHLKFTQKEDDFDSLNWSFKYKGIPLTLQYNIYNGISMFPYKMDAGPKENKAVTELATVLQHKMLHMPAYGLIA